MKFNAGDYVILSEYGRDVFSHQLKHFKRGPGIVLSSRAGNPPKDWIWVMLADGSEMPYPYRALRHVSTIKKITYLLKK